MAFSRRPKNACSAVRVGSAALRSIFQSLLSCDRHDHHFPHKALRHLREQVCLSHSGARQVESLSPRRHLPLTALLRRKLMTPDNGDSSSFMFKRLLTEKSYGLARCSPFYSLSCHKAASHSHLPSSSDTQLFGALTEWRLCNLRFPLMSAFIFPNNLCDS